MKNKRINSKTQNMKEDMNGLKIAEIMEGSPLVQSGSKITHELSDGRLSTCISAA